jgi:hypothetical protein
VNANRWMKSFINQLLPQVIACLVVLFLIVSCGGYSTKTLDSYVGKTTDDLLAGFGAPDDILQGQDGGEIYVYRSTKHVTSMVGGVAVTKKKTRQYLFWIDEKNIVRRWAKK